MIEETKPLVRGDKRGWVWMSRKTFKRLLLENLDKQDSHATNKINGLSPQYSSTGDWF